MANKRIVPVCTGCQCVIADDGSAFVHIDCSRIRPGYEISHGLCNACYAKEREQLAAFKAYRSQAVTA